MAGLSWRLVLSSPADGYFNMAADEVLFRRFRPGIDLPLFRVYLWQPPAFSLGCNQSILELLIPEKIEQDNIAVVRRMTGGGAIYHSCEITYSLITSPEMLDSSSVKDGFRRVTGFLLCFYEELGLSPCFAGDSEFSSPERGRPVPVCFAGQEEYDIVIQGRKIGGNAQRRSRDKLFQHGSIPWDYQPEEFVSYLRRVPSNMDAPAGLRQWGVSLSPADLTEILIRSFRDYWRADFIPAPLTPDELSEIGELAEEKRISGLWRETSAVRREVWT